MKDEMRHKWGKVSWQQCFLFARGITTAMHFFLSMVSQMQCYLFLCLSYYDSSAFGLSMVYSVILSVAQAVKNQTLRQCVNNEVGTMQKKVVMV